MHYLYEPDSFVPVAQALRNGPVRLHKQPDWSGRSYDFDQDPLWHTPVTPQAFDAIAWYQCDHLGTPMELTDHTGEVAWAAQYKAWGEVREERSGWAKQIGLNNPIRFQGQYHDRETGLHYNRYRYYDPGVGRFVSKDPISYAGGLNLHQYAANPVGWIDPLGLEGCEKACKSRNKPPAPMEAAEGRPHSIIERPGVDGQYTTHYGDGTWKQYRGSGKDHGSIPRPNIKEAIKNPAPDGRVFIHKGRVRTPFPHEVPKGE